MQGRRKATIEITVDAGVAVRRSPLLLILGRTLSVFDRASIFAWISTKVAKDCRKRGGGCELLGEGSEIVLQKGKQLYI